MATKTDVMQSRFRVRPRTSHTLAARLLCLLVSLVVIGSGLASADQFEANPLPPLPPPIADWDNVDPNKESGEPKPSSGHGILQRHPNRGATRLRPELEQLDKALDTLKGKAPDKAATIEREIREMLKRKTLQANLLTQEATDYRFRSVHNINQPRFREAEEQLQRLKLSGATDSASRLEALLQRLRIIQETGEYRETGGDEPEIHQVSLKHGTALPKHLRTESNRWQTGFAEVHLQHSSHPIILILAAEESIIWRITSSKDTRVFAIVIDSSKQQTILGMDTTLVLNARRDLQLLTRSHGTTPSNAIQFSKTGELVAGGKPITQYVGKTYPGAPIVIGPKNKEWLDSYLINDVEDIIAECQRLRQEAQARRLRHIRFSATFSTSSVGTNAIEASRGEFSIAGPIASTLRPLPIRNLTHIVSDVDHNNQTASFALDKDGLLVTVTTDNESPKQVPLPLPRRLRSTRFQSIAYDLDRKRLLLATRANGRRSKIMSFDIQDAEWKELISLESTIVGMNYIDRTDEIWAVTSNYQVSNAEISEFIRIDSLGDIITRHRLSDSLHTQAAQRPSKANRTPRLTSVHLVESDGLAILVGTRLPPNIPGVVSDHGPEITVIDSATGEIVYAGPIHVATEIDPLDQIRRSHAGIAQTPRPARISVLTDIANGLKQLRDLLTNREDSPVATESHRQLAEGIAAVESLLRDGSAEQSQPRVYLVGRYSAPKGAHIRVTDTSAPVILVLCGNHSIEWSVEMAEGVRLARVILAGRLPQSLANSPKGVTIDSVSNREGFAFYDARNLDQLAKAQERVSTMTGGLRIAAFHVSHHNTGIQTVGPDDHGLRVQLIKHHLEDLRDKATSRHRSQELANLAEARFFAIHQGKLPHSPQTPHTGRRTRTIDNIYWNQFSIRGPLIGETTPLHTSTRFAAWNSVSKQLCSGTSSALNIRDVEKKTTTSIDLRKLRPSVGQLGGIGFDESRNRLLINGSRGIFSYQLHSQALECLRTSERTARSAFAYDSKREIIYSVQLSNRRRGEIQEIDRLNAHGVRLSPIRLEQPIRLANASGYGFSFLQLVPLGTSHLAVLRYETDTAMQIVRGVRIRRQTKGKLTIVRIEHAETESAQTVYEGPIRPCLTFHEISEAELTKTWQSLGEAETESADSLIWKLAAGGQASLAFIRNKYSPASERLTRLEITQLTKQLDDRRFSNRDHAFKALQAAGKRIQPELTPYLESPDTPPEVRERLRTIVSNWIVGDPQTPDEWRQIRGLDVLLRMGLPAAQDFLESLTQEKYDDLIREHAERILDNQTATDYANPAMRLQHNLFTPKK